MRLELTGRHITVTPAVKKAVDQRITHLGRILNESVVSIQVVLTGEKSRCKAEVTLHARREHFMHGESTGKDAMTAVAGAFDKVDRQALKLKSKWTRGKRQGVSASKSAAGAIAPRNDDGAERQVRIVRARRYEVKPMSVDEAAFEVGDDQSAFVVFRNSSTDTINVLFRRPDGNLGLIEPEA